MRLSDQLYNHYKKLAKKGEEAFFGVDNEVKINYINYIRRIREQYVLGETKKNEKANDNILKICKEFETYIAKAFNVEKCYLGLQNEFNAYCIPAFWDNSFVKKDSKTNKKEIDTELVKDFNNIIETKNGYRYKNPKGKVLIFCLGLKFFTSNKDHSYTDEEIAAILFHETGHGFQHMLNNVEYNIGNVVQMDILNNLHAVMRPFWICLAIGLAPWLPSAALYISVIWIISLIIGSAQYIDNESKLYEENTEDFGISIMLDVLGDEKDGANRNSMGKDIVDSSVDELNKKREKNKTTIFRKLGKYIYNSIVGLFKIVDSVMPMSIIDLLFTTFYVKVYHKEKYNKSKQWEEFADHFAASYGLGPDLASGLSKLGNDRNRVELGMFNFINYVPLVNIVVNYNALQQEACGELMAGYPSFNQRIAGIYQTLKYELKNNKELSPEDRKNIEEQIDDIMETYDKYVYGKGSGKFCYILYHKILGSRIDNENLTIEENVLDALKSLKDSKDAEIIDKELKEEVKNDEELIKEAKEVDTHRTFSNFLISTIANKIPKPLERRLRFDILNGFKKM